MKYRVLLFIVVILASFAAFASDQCLECRRGECRWVNHDAYRFCNVTWESCSADSDCLFVAENTLQEDPWLLAEFSVQSVDVRHATDASVAVAVNEGTKPHSRDTGIRIARLAR